MLNWIAYLSLSLSYMKEMASKGAVVEASTSPKVECCMCGDYGLLEQLFQCRVCLLRSQHRYCSSIYPKTESYDQVCNWCLRKQRENSDGTRSSSISSSSSSNKTNDRKVGLKNSSSTEGNVYVGPKVQRSKSELKNNYPSKKPRLADKALETSKINISEIKNKIIKKQVFPGKVRKYKLLEDV
ncbi:hypothetical protein IFM89_038555 [Coptis chinensis]|uniref:PHD-type zinc finger plants domain-containing protein n=1 Tax=Coptis chinensis TaxID=261450 RepID=A0A835HGU8_9MAGN|nr:hypothetical protein IFM89_038555 [Coptis chinensis]